MNNQALAGYHATKIFDKTLILKNGLKANDWNRYSGMLFNTYKKLGIGNADIIEIKTIIESEYIRKYTHINYTGHVCFFVILKMLDRDKGGYDQFCENIGGELARKALKEKYRLFKFPVG